jgi:ATP-dependent DNA ligase
VKSKDFNALASAKVRFIEPMYALPVQSLPRGKNWLYEVKFDGYRCLAGRDAKGVTGRLAVLQDRFLRYRDRPRKR